MDTPITPEHASALNDLQIREDYQKALENLNELLSREWYTGRSEPVTFSNLPKHNKARKMLQDAFEKAGWHIRPETGVAFRNEGSWWKISKA